MAGAAQGRLRKELQMLATDPPPGVCAWPVGDALNHLQAQIQGPDETPYARGIFLLDVNVPDRYTVLIEHCDFTILMHARLWLSSTNSQLHVNPAPQCTSTGTLLSLLRCASSLLSTTPTWTQEGASAWTRSRCVLLAPGLLQSTYQHC
jgi:Ubiquitin-conjugating enzyme